MSTHRVVRNSYRRGARVLSMLVALVVLLECGLRFGLDLGDPVLAELDPDVEYMLVPSRTYHRFWNRISVNSHRMRAREFPLQPAPDEHRVMLVGDSVVYGNHFLDQAETIAARLEHVLDRQGLDWTVGAIAASSWGPPNQLAFVRRYGWFGAEAVIIVVSSHDLADVPVHDPDLVPYRVNTTPLALVDAGRAVWERILRRVRSRPRESVRARRARALAALDALLSSARTLRADVRVYFHPTRSELGEPSLADAACGTIQVLSRANGAAFTDLRAYYASAGGSALYEDEIHPSPAGAAALALRFADDLVTVPAR